MARTDGRQWRLGRWADWAGWRACADVLGVVLVVGVIGCGGSESAQTGSAESAPQSGVVSPGQRASTSLPVVKRVPAAVRAKFAVFRSPAEGLPVIVMQTLREPTRGSNWSLAQRLRGIRWPIWLVPGRGFFCLVDAQSRRGGVGQVCATTKSFLTRGVFITTLSAGQDTFAGGQAKSVERTVIGVVPDGTRMVRVHTQGFPTASAAVRKNVFMLRDRTDAAAETLTLVP